MLFRESEGQFEYGNYRREADDLHSVVSDLSQKNFDVIAIVGHSKGYISIQISLFSIQHVIMILIGSNFCSLGGDDVLLYASTYDDVKMVLNLSGRFDLKVGVKERFGEEFMQNIEKVGFVDMKDEKGINIMLVMNFTGDQEVFESY